MVELMKVERVWSVTEFERNEVEWMRAGGTELDVDE